MNSVFDFNRWLLYIGKHWNENKKKYLLSLAAIGGLLILWFSFLMLVNKWHSMQEEIQAVTYYVGLFLTGCLYASLLFSELSDGPKAIHFLLVPASLLEKLLSAILFGVILFFIGYTIIFCIVDFTMLKVSNSIIKTMAEQQHLGSFTVQKMINPFVSPAHRGDNFYVIFLLVYFAVQSLFLLGSVYFINYHFIKTLVSGLIVFLILVFFVHKVLGSFMPDGGFFKPYTVYRIYDGVKGELSVTLPEWFSVIMLFLTKYALAPCLWVVTYFRLKEKEV